jgi:hypothetical protein
MALEKVFFQVVTKERTSIHQNEEKPYFHRINKQNETDENKPSFNDSFNVQLETNHL